MKARGWLSLCLGWGVGCRKQWEQKSPWGWDRHSVADRYRQAPSRMLSWAKEFKQALNLNREEASPPPHSNPPNKTWQFPFAGLRPAVAGQLAPTPVSLPTFVKSQAILLLAWAVQPLPSPLFVFFSLHSCLFPLFPTEI